MRLKKTIAYLLMCITFLLNVIPLIPHHHHKNDIAAICLLDDTDFDSCNPKKSNTETPFTNKECADCCITNFTPIKSSSTNYELDFPVLSDSVLLVYHDFDFTTPCITLKEKSRTTQSSIESLQTNSPHGLRAPPIFTL